MINNRINKLVSKFKRYDIDGYIIPKNDEFFSEYSANDRLKAITNFSGSAGYSIILKNKKYLFVDGRYTIQAKKEVGKSFKIVDLHKIINCDLFQNLSIDDLKNQFQIYFTSSFCNHLQLLFTITFCNMQSFAISFCNHFLQKLQSFFAY